MNARRLLFAAGLVCAATFVGCGGPQIAKLESRVNDLNEEVAELRRGQAAQRVQFDEFRNRLVLLQDKLDSQRVQAARVNRHAVSDAPDSLPHVVVPPTPRAAAVASARLSRPLPSRLAGPQPSRMPVRARTPMPTLMPTSSAPATRSVVIGPDGVVRETGSSARPALKGAPSKNALGRPPKAKTTRPAGPVQTKAPPQNQSPAERAAGAYRAAKALLDASQLRPARDAFSAFLRDHPDHPLSDNALYWMGETWYAQSLWLRAARVFGQVVERYPSGNKVPDSMLKTGLCYRNLGENKLARETFEQLISMFPGAPVARIAKRQLSRLGSTK